MGLHCKSRASSEIITPITLHSGTHNWTQPFQYKGDTDKLEEVQWQRATSPDGGREAEGAGFIQPGEA